MVKNFTNVFLVFLTIIFIKQPCLAQEQKSAQSPAAVVHQGQRLFVYFAELDGLDPKERARQTIEIVHELANDPNFNPEKIRVVEVPEGSSVVYGDRTIATAAIADAEIAKDSTRRMAAQFASKLRHLLVRKVEELTAGKIAYASGLTAAIGVLLLMVVALICKVSWAVSDKVKNWKGTVIKSVRIQEAELFSEEMLGNLFLSFIQLIQIFVILVCAYFAALFILDSWPATKELAETIRDTSYAPIASSLEAIVGYLPKLLVIAAITVLTQGAITFARFFFDAMDAGTIKFSGFDQDWARPTFTLTRLLIIALALVLALPFFPGWESEAFKQVGLLFGLLLSLGSTQVVGQVMGGTVLTYSNAFKVGDCIKIGSHFGIIQEKTVFVTRIKTPKNEIVSIPNGQVIGSDIINYSRMAQTGELVLHTSVTIGYDVSWRLVRDLLLEAAAETEGVVKSPAPFVLATQLGDFTVSYELNAHTDQAGNIPSTYSRLHECILDKFNKAGVEIMSPHIFSLRDGNSAALPQENLAAAGQVPRQFMVSIKNP